MDNEFIKIALQTGDPLKDGINGCCFGDVIDWAIKHASDRNISKPSQEMALILKKLSEVKFWLTLMEAKA